MGVLLGLVPPAGPPVPRPAASCAQGWCWWLGRGQGDLTGVCVCVAPPGEGAQQIIDLSSQWQGKKPQTNPLPDWPENRGEQWLCLGGDESL